MQMLCRFGVLLIAMVVVACGGAQPEAKRPSEALALQSGSSGAAPPIENIQTPITQLLRSDVVETVDAGLGRFLGNFAIEASLNDEGSFLGFRIVKVRQPAKFRGLGLGSGDVITRINDMPIERPAQAYAAFVALKNASSLDVSYLRAGRQMRLSLPIVGDAVPESSAASKLKEKSAGSRDEETGDSKGEDVSKSETSSKQ